MKASQLWLSNATLMYRFAHLFAAGRRGDWNEWICWFTHTARRQQLIGFVIQWLVNIVFLKVNWLRKRAAFRIECTGGYSLLGFGSQVLRKWAWDRGAPALAGAALVTEGQEALRSIACTFLLWYQHNGVFFGCSSLKDFGGRRQALSCEITAPKTKLFGLPNSWARS